MLTFLIFLTTYAVVAIGRAPGLRVDRTGAALVGATLMVVTGASASTMRCGRLTSERSCCCSA